MAFRFPQRPPRDATELFQWLRELLPDLELKILENCLVGTTKTAIAHGLGCVPFWVRCSTPHCISVVRQVQKADAKNVYLRATNPCVVDVLVVKYAQLAQLMTSIRNGGYELQDWDPSGTALGDHKVAIDQTDEDAGGADYLHYQLIDGARTSWHVDTTGGQRRMRVEVDTSGVDDHMVMASSTDTEPKYLHSAIAAGDGINTDLIPNSDPQSQAVQVSARFSQVTPQPVAVSGSPGDPADATVSRGSHIHAFSPQADPDPAVTATRLFPAKIVDPLNRGFITCCYLGPHFAGGNTPMLIGWTQVAPGVFENPTEGPIASTWLDGVSVETYGTDGYSSMVGKTVLAYYQGDTSELGDEEPLQQLYIVEDTGAHYENYGTPSQVYVETKARLRRITAYSTSSQWVHGMTFQIQAGNVYGTDFFTFDNTGAFTLGTTPIEWAHTDGPTFTWADRYELLTGPQLTSEGASTATETWDLTMASGDSDATAVETLLGTPGVTTIPAAAWLFDVEAIHIDSVPSGTTTTLRVEVRADNGVTAPVLFTSESPPIVNTSAAALSFATDYAGTTLSNTDRLVAIYRLHTDSTEPVALHIRYNSATRGTRITVPFQMAIAGGADGDHNHLSNRGIRGQHPTLAIDPSPQQFVTITAGVMPAVAYGSWAHVTASSANLDAIDAADFPDYGELEVYFSVACAIRSDQTASGTNRPIRTYKSTFASYQTFNARAGATVRFRYRPDLGTSGMWLITGVQQG